MKLWVLTVITPHCVFPIVLCQSLSFLTVGPETEVLFHERLPLARGLLDSMSMLGIVQQ